MSNGTGLGNATLGASSGTSLILAINEYATVISLSLTFIGILAGIVFHVLTLRDRRKQMEIDLLKLNGESNVKDQRLKK